MERTPVAVRWKPRSCIRLATVCGLVLVVSLLADGCGQESIPEAQSHEQNVANHDIPKEADIHFVLYGWQPVVTVETGGQTFDDGQQPTQTVDCDDQVQASRAIRR
jgi:hypothetical protein